jgi:hypothetical protein
MTAQNGYKAPTAAQTATVLVDKSNQLTAAYFAAVILGLMGLFSAFHLAGTVLLSQQSKHGPSTKRIVVTARYDIISKQSQNSTI